MQEDWQPENPQTVVNNHPVYTPPDEAQTVTHIPPVSNPPHQAARPSVPTAVNSTPVNRGATYYSDTMRPPPPPDASRESAARERVRRRRVKNRHNGGEWAWVVIALTMLGVVVMVSMGIFVLLQAAQQPPEVIPTAAAVLPTPVDARNDFGGGNGTGQVMTLSDGRSIELIPWDGSSRFTFLMVGLDRRPGETGLAYRTDTMMLISIDPATNSLGILSIPRDLYVDVPGYSEPQRVNSPMVLGELRQPGFGPQLMMQTVQYNLGMRVNDYMAVDFNTFITLVDAIGGVDINVPYNISDPQYPNMYYGYDPFYLRAGFQHLDGATALKYARTRHGDNDFQRAERQQAVMYAIREKILDLDMLPQLIVQAPMLWNQLSMGISTGLQFEQIIQLALYLKDIPGENIRTGVINDRYTIGYMTSQGASVLVPDRERIGPLMVEVFGPNYSQ